MFALNPYLNFKGNAEEAFNFYKSVFGGEFAMVMRFKDMPGEGSVDPSLQDKIMHIALPVGPNMLMASDVIGPMGDNMVMGNSTYIMISPETEAETRRIYEALSTGGDINMPLQLMFWGDLYSSFTDKFGTNWMISFNEKYHQQQ
ncbi:VOC family protein [Mucilaginibacter koreensis]